MLTLLKNPACFQVLSIIGSSVIILCAFIAGAAYQGKTGERYSPFNHYISELGEPGISSLSWVFNLGLIICGLCLLPACFSLGLLLPGIWSKLGMTAGIISSISLSCVGLFPMNKMTQHVRAAVTYFRMGLVMILFFTLALSLQSENPPLAPPLLSLVGIPAILSFSSFLIYSRIGDRPSSNSLSTEGVIRPRIWWMAISEWSIFLTSVLWFVAVALGL